MAETSLAPNDSFSLAHLSKRRYSGLPQFERRLILERFAHVVGHGTAVANQEYKPVHKLDSDARAIE
ncbi:MAG: hypothetical protein ACR2PG_07475 [Hyphomicrobiaceae bacterium]